MASVHSGGRFSHTFSAIRCSRQYEQQRSITPKPIIALTAHSDLVVRKKTQAAGMNDFLNKPIDVDKLVTLILKNTHLEDYDDL